MAILLTPLFPVVDIFVIRLLTFIIEFQDLNGLSVKDFFCRRNFIRLDPIIDVYLKFVIYSVLIDSTTSSEMRVQGAANKEGPRKGCYSYLVQVWRQLEG